MVYDATRSKLNESLWAPSFGLPTVESLLRGIEEETWMGDLDIGEMFLNFGLHPTLQPYAGVDLRPYFGQKGKGQTTLWERWVRCLMGLKSSPYFCIKGLLLALEMVVGDITSPSNPFHWSHLELNLPGDPSYDPSRPKLARMRGNQLAALIMTYVDNMRAAAGGRQNCWDVMHRVASYLGYLGIQVAARKTRPPSKQPGPWSGAMIVTEAEGVGVKATQDKWAKTRCLLQQTLTYIDSGKPICRKELESIRGTLVYLQRTYPAITPYVKGYHLTIDSWREDRDEEGWKRREPDSSSSNSLQPPTHVHAVPRFRNDVLALLHLFSAPEPPVRYVRSQQINVACYGFADASGTGFGATVGDQSQLFYSHGIWNNYTEDQSSNYRELVNLVNVLEEGVASGRLLDTETWIFTDNSTSEAVFWKGHSPSRTLNDLALRLRTLEMNSRIRIHMVHVAGSRMIAQGTDGLSRGDLTEGVMTGESMLNHVPLHRSALERQSALLPWLRSWLPEATATCVLSPKQWFFEGHGLVGGCTNGDGIWTPTEVDTAWYIWHPPPALADVAVEELDVSRHKRPHLAHVVLVPRLMTYAWRKRLSKICDILLEIPPGTRSFWPSHEHEPLLIGIALPFSSQSPWQVKSHPRVLELGRQLRDLWRGEEGSEWRVLRQFCLPEEWLARM